MGFKCNLLSRIKTVLGPTYQHLTYGSNDLTKSRIPKDEESVSSLKTALTETFINQFSEN